MTDASVVVRRFVAIVMLFVPVGLADAQWTRTEYPGLGTPSALVTNGANVFAATWLPGAFYFYRSTDNGTSWSTASNGIDLQIILCVAFCGPNVLAGTQSAGMIYLSSDNGASWTRTWGGVPGKVTGMAVSGADVFATTYGDGGKGVLRSTNSGKDWGGNLIKPNTLNSFSTRS